jgi:hypothetical protein
MEPDGSGHSLSTMDEAESRTPPPASKPAPRARRRPFTMADLPAFVADEDDDDCLCGQARPEGPLVVSSITS